MTNSIFATVDSFSSRFKLVDSLVNTVAAHLLPQHEASGVSCPSDHPLYCGQTCGDRCDCFSSDYWLYCSKYSTCAGGIMIKINECGCGQAEGVQPDC